MSSPKRQRIQFLRTSQGGSALSPDPHHLARRRARARREFSRLCVEHLEVDPTGLLAWLARNVDEWKVSGFHEPVRLAGEHVAQHGCTWRSRDEVCCAIRAFFWLGAGLQQTSRRPYLIPAVKATGRYATSIRASRAALEKVILHEPQSVLLSRSVRSEAQRRDRALLEKLLKDGMAFEESVAALQRRLESSATAPSAAQRQSNYRAHVGGAEAELRRGGLSDVRIMSMVRDCKGKPEQRAQRLGTRLRHARARLEIIVK
jgi:hypothetical protein